MVWKYFHANIFLSVLKGNQSIRHSRKANYVATCVTFPLKVPFLLSGMENIKIWLVKGKLLLNEEVRTAIIFRKMKLRHKMHSFKAECQNFLHFNANSTIKIFFISHLTWLMRLQMLKTHSTEHFDKNYYIEFWQNYPILFVSVNSKHLETNL